MPGGGTIALSDYKYSASRSQTDRTDRQADTRQPDTQNVSTDAQTDGRPDERRATQTDRLPTARAKKRTKLN